MTLIEEKIGGRMVEYVDGPIEEEVLSIGSAIRAL